MKLMKLMTASIYNYANLYLNDIYYIVLKGTGDKDEYGKSVEC